MNNETLNTLKEGKINQLSYNQFCQLINCTGDDQKDLFTIANEKKENGYGNKVFVRGVIEISNACLNKCNYCSMNVENTELKRYTLTLEEIQKSVDEGIKNGIRVFHLSSGENCEFSDGLLLDMVEYIYEKGCKIILVIGKRKYSLLKKLYEKGVSVFISKFETSNPWLYSEYNNKNGSHDLRVEYLRKLREIGYKIGTGNIVGLPFQRDSTLYEDLKLLCKLHSEQASTSRFISNPYSKYSKYESGSITKTKNFIALMRIFMDEHTIIPTNSSIGLEDKFDALLAGANLLSINLTPKDKCKNYIIYNDETRIQQNLDYYIQRVREMQLDIEYEF